MKKILGLCILVILFLVVTGCTQSAPSTVATPAPTIEPTMANPSETITDNPTPMLTVEETATAIVTTVTIKPTLTSVETTVPPTPSPIQTPLVNAKVIHIQNNSFVPPVTTVLPGTGITWINDDTISHAVKITGTHEGMFNSGDIASGSTWSYTFGASVGTFTYADPKFPMAVGTIIIQNGRSIISTTPLAVQRTS